jgi:hypothetical protein
LESSNSAGCGGGGAAGCSNKLGKFYDVPIM